MCHFSKANSSLKQRDGRECVRESDRERENECPIINCVPDDLWIYGTTSNANTNTNTQAKMGKSCQEFYNAMAIVYEIHTLLLVFFSSFHSFCFQFWDKWFPVAWSLYGCVFENNINIFAYFFSRIRYFWCCFVCEYIHHKNTENHIVSASMYFIRTVCVSTRTVCVFFASFLCMNVCVYTIVA